MMRAFPTNKTLLMQDDNEKLYVQSFENLGMDLRDYFAAKAMQIFCNNGDFNEPDAGAKLAYEYADAMMKAREANGE